MSLPIQRYAQTHNKHFSGVAAGDKHLVFARDYFALQPILVQTAVELTENWIDSTDEPSPAQSWFERTFHPKPAEEPSRKEVLHKISAYFLEVLQNHGSMDSVVLMRKLLDYVRWTVRGREVWSVFSQFYTQASVMSVLYLNAQPPPGAETQYPLTLLSTFTGGLPWKLRQQVLSKAVQAGVLPAQPSQRLADTEDKQNHWDSLVRWEAMIKEAEETCASAGKQNS